MGWGWGMALPLAMGTRHWLPQIGPGAVSADRDSVHPSLLPMAWSGLECQRVAAASIDSLIGCVVCLPSPAVCPSSPQGKAAAWQWSDVDKAHPRQRRRLNCRTFYSRPFFVGPAAPTSRSVPLQLLPHGHHHHVQNPSASVTQCCKHVELILLSYKQSNITISCY